MGRSLAYNAAMEFQWDEAQERRLLHRLWFGSMSKIRLTIDPDKPESFPRGPVNDEALDATTEEDIARQAREDDAEAMRDMGRFARRVRRRLGLTQVEFARRIDVPHETIRNWEQGKRGPTGAARALLRIIDKAPETALRVLG